MTWTEFALFAALLFVAPMVVARYLDRRDPESEAEDLAETLDHRRCHARDARHG